MQKKKKKTSHPSGSCFRAFWGVFPLCHFSVVKPKIVYGPVSVQFKQFYTVKYFISHFDWEKMLYFTLYVKFGLDALC